MDRLFPRRVVAAVGAAGVLLAACTIDQAGGGGASPAPKPQAGLAGTAWTLVHFQSSADEIGILTPPNPERYTLEFLPDGSLAAQLDCNRAMGRWHAEPSSPTMGTLTVTGGAMTRAMCGPGAMDAKIARDLDHIASYVFADGKLHLALKLDSGIYVWAPLAKSAR